MEHNGTTTNNNRHIFSSSSSSNCTTQSNSFSVVLDNNNLPPSWEPNINTTNNPSRFFWTHHNPTTTTTHDFTTHALLLQHSACDQHQMKQASVYTSKMLHPDPHLVCLRLGKRHYFDDDDYDDGGRVHRHVDLQAGIGNMGKRGRSLYGGSGCEVVPTAASVPRCQVEGCQVVLVNAKDYHKRHKVCEMHSKAPKVVVLGLEQRFCQQCSRFHVVSEFDDSKRSCRRRLAGHNERRRKTSHDSNPKTSFQGGAFSLLSTNSDSWDSPSDFSLRSSAALQELIAENRAAILARQLIRDQDYQVHQHWLIEDHGEGNSSLVNQHQQIAPEQNEWEKFNNMGSHVTLELDLMQTPSSAFGLLTTREKSKESEEGCSAVWNCLDGAHVL